MYEDEASFWLDGTLHQTWARIGVQPRVDTFGMRKTAHLFGALSLEVRPRFQYQFAAVFNAQAFLDFLKQLVRRTRRTVFLVIDNSPCHNLAADGRAWLDARDELRVLVLGKTAPPILPGVQSHRGGVEADETADHSQHVLPHHGGTRCRAHRHVRALPCSARAHRPASRQIPVMIPCPRDSV